MSGLTPHQAKVTEWLGNQQEAMLALLAEVVNIDSSGFTAGVGCPTLCATGPVGGNAHTPEEYLEIGSLVPRAQTLALAILRLPAAAA